jgi:hypothetical protein
VHDLISLRELNRRRRLSRMRRGVVTAGELHRDEHGQRVRAAMITLTYRDDVRWSPQHISECLKKWRAELGGKLKYVWVMELTKRGRPHYHVVVWLPHGRKLRMPDRSGAWPHGMSQIAWARNAVGYLVKYATKGSAGLELPKGARLFGVGGLNADSRLQRSWVMLPLYIRKCVQAGDRVKRCPGGGWVSSDTGEWWPAVSLLLARSGEELSGSG